MRKRISFALLILLLSQSVLAVMIPSAAAASSQMTKYRVYQNDNALREFANKDQAITYARQFGYSHVETIAERDWVWDNFPRYIVYQNGESNPKLEFQSYDQALNAAKGLTNAYVRDLQNIGWEYENYVRYRLYQGDKTYDGWEFVTLDAAKQEARKWSNAHIIDLSSNQWAWNNLTADEKKQQRAATPAYQVQVDGEPVSQALYSFLYDASNASAKYVGSQIVNTATGRIAQNNISFDVVKYGELISSFVSLDEAVAHAKKTPYSEVLYDGKVYWSGVPYLTVYQGDKKLRLFNTKGSAIPFAKGYENSSIVHADGRTIWSNKKSLIYLAWNGSATSQTVLNHVANTQGLSIDSPTWFELAAADGTLKDTSDPVIVKTFKEQGIEVMPLVHNQFDRNLTTKFLKDSKAQQSFINSLVDRLVKLGVSGVNLDFEAIAGSDRAAYTAFVTKLADAVHAKGLKLSIDLPRGEKSWNHLTAYDHAALAEVVDMIMIMAYDEHWSGSDTPGSVSGLAWAEEGVKQFLDYGVPRNKLMLGVPFYVREWKLDANGKLVGNRAIFMKEIPKLIEDTNAQGVFDPESGQLKYKYVKDGFTYLLWAETEDTMKARIQIALKYDLAGVAAWRLGYESADLWTMMLQMK